MTRNRVFWSIIKKLRDKHDFYKDLGKQNNRFYILINVKLNLLMYFLWKEEYKVTIKNEIKSTLAMHGWTMTEVVDALNEKHGRNDTIQNLSNKLAKGTLRYSEALEISEVIGCRLEWKKTHD